MKSEPSFDAARRTLEERAQRLAKPIAPAAVDTIELFVLPLGHERYGIDISFVIEVLRGTSVVPVPGTPDIVVGVANRRGAILPVFDLRRLFGSTAGMANAVGDIVVLGVEHGEFGLMAESGSETVMIERSSIVAETPFTGGEGQEFVAGTTGAIVVLDGRALLSDQRLFIDGGRGTNGASRRTGD